MSDEPVQRKPIDYVVQGASINEAGTYSRIALGPGSINEPPVNPPAVPVLSSLVPASAAANSGNVTLKCMGTGFGDWTSVVFNDVERAVIFVSNTEVDTILSTRLTNGTYPVKLKNGSFVSNIKTFTIT